MQAGAQFMWQSHWENAQAAAEGLLSALLWLGTDWGMAF